MTDRARKANCKPYRLIMMDINMPIMDGFEATELIRNHVGKEQTMIVGASAYPRSQIEEPGKAAGMDDFIGKPIDPIEVAAILRRSNLVT